MAAVGPGQHLVDLGMTQVSIMNPLMIGAGSCALILTAEPGKTYHIRPPSFGTYYRFWYNIGTFTLLQKRFRSTVSVAVSGGGEPERSLDLSRSASTMSIFRSARARWWYRRRVRTTLISQMAMMHRSPHNRPAITDPDAAPAPSWPVDPTGPEEFRHV